MSDDRLSDPNGMMKRPMVKELIIESTPRPTSALQEMVRKSLREAVLRDIWQAYRDPDRKVDYSWDLGVEMSPTPIPARSYPDTPKGRQQARLAEVRPTITAAEVNEWLASLPSIPIE